MKPSTPAAPPPPVQVPAAATPNLPARPPSLPRRAFVRRGALWLVGGSLLRLPSPRAAGAADSAGVILDTRVISPPSSPYAGWPTVARRRNGYLWLVWSGGREQHVCPFGQVYAMSSTDQGDSWTWPRVLLDGPLDDRDAGIVETSRGTLLATTFTSLAYEPALRQAEQSGSWPADRLARWQAVHRRLPAPERSAELGQWMMRSTDGGRSWSARYDCQANSPHGPVPLADGRLLYAGKELWTGDRRTGFWASTDDGLRWDWLAPLPVRPGDGADQYHELHAVECPSGRLLAHLRNENKTDENETLQTESADGGRTWTMPHRLRLADGTDGVWGLPSHLLRLRDGRILMTYGHRRSPLGNQARVSNDEGRTWSAPIVLSGDGASGDLGYPSTVELDDGRLLTVWYEVLAGSPRAVLRQARWKLG